LKPSPSLTLTRALKEYALNGNDFIEGIKRKVIDETGESGTDRQIADYLGITMQALANWRGSDEITVRQMVGLVSRVKEKAIDRTEREAVRPVVEFFRLALVPSRGGDRQEIFGVRDENGVEHPYLKGLRSELEEHSGVYLFYDSRGRALYAGKARYQSLWKEINLAFNRDRQVQKIRRVDHPERRQDFRTSDEIRRQIKLRAVPLHELATYVSAYAVANGLINSVEAMLIRGFPNDLLNARMENLNW
jgi:hypothetical protein